MPDHDGMGMPACFCEFIFKSSRILEYLAYTVWSSHEEASTVMNGCRQEHTDVMLSSLLRICRGGSLLHLQDSILVEPDISAMRVSGPVAVWQSGCGFEDFTCMMCTMACLHSIARSSVTTAHPSTPSIHAHTYESYHSTPSGRGFSHTASSPSLHVHGSMEARVTQICEQASSGVMRSRCGMGGIDRSRISHNQRSVAQAWSQGQNIRLGLFSVLK